MTEPAYEYIQARRTLLDALDALQSHRNSLVLIGAQAVFLHTGSTGLSVPPMTTDADLALNTDLLADDPEIAPCCAQQGSRTNSNLDTGKTLQGSPWTSWSPHTSPTERRRRHAPPIWVRIRRPWRASAA